MTQFRTKSQKRISKTKHLTAMASARHTAATLVQRGTPSPTLQERLFARMGSEGMGRDWPSNVNVIDIAQMVMNRQA
jgi:hypothetical protein